MKNMKQPAAWTAILCSALSAGSLLAGTVNSSSHKEHGFDNSKISPFVEDQGYTNISGEGMSFQNSSYGAKRLKINWKESEYDGSRRERGHELKLQVTDDDELFCGFYWFTGNQSNNNILNKNTIIWQMYCWNSAGCSNWTAHITLKSNDDLYLSTRNSCTTAQEVKIFDNVKKNTNYRWTMRTRVGQGNGKFVFKNNGSDKYNNSSRKIGFGNISNGKMTDAVMGVKMGLYCYDTSNYSNNEIRNCYLDNLAVSKKSGTVTNSFNKVDPKNF